MYMEYHVIKGQILKVSYYITMGSRTSKFNNFGYPRCQKIPQGANKNTLYIYDNLTNMIELCMNLPNEDNFIVHKF